MHHWWHGTHRYDIQVLATHVSTLVHRYSSLLQWSVPLGQRGHVAMLLCVLCTKCTLHSNHRLNSRDVPTHKMTSPTERPFSHYIHSHRLAAEMWTTIKKATYWGNKVFDLFLLSVNFRKYLSYGFSYNKFLKSRSTLWIALYVTVCCWFLWLVFEHSDKF